MENEQTPTEAAISDMATDQETLLASQVESIGVNPHAEPEVPGAAAADAADASATATTDQAATTDAAAASAAAPATTEAAAAAEPAAAASEPAPEPAVNVAAPTPAPQPSRDFDAAIAENQRKFDDGEIEGAEYQAELRKITKEEAQYTARLEIWTERQQTAADLANQAFNTVAVDWERNNAEFMSNPLRAQQMQAAVDAVVAKTPGLAPAKLFEEAAKIAFEAFNWKPKTPDPVVDVEAAKQAALAARAPSGVPATLAASPSAAPIEAAASNSAYASLDSKDISSLEDAVARMSPEQRDAYLRDAPGANATGVPGAG